jgi:hypothetical protein
MQLTVDSCVEAIPRSVAVALVAAAAFFLMSAGVAAADGGAAGLRSAYEAHRADLANSKFGKPLHLSSKQSSSRLEGEILAVVDQPFARAQAALADPKNWCDILILHPNVKDCHRNASGPNGTTLALSLGRAELPAQFAYTARREADYLDVRLRSPEGPMGTTDYQIRLEATRLDAEHTLLRLNYSHAYGVQARMAMRAYFGTLGRGKVGFTVVSQDAQGKPVYVSDLRGGLERNAMRYYASIDAFLDALAAPPGQQLERRLRHWYAYTERFPLQLQEEQGYLEAKRREATAVARNGQASG